MGHLRGTLLWLCTVSLVLAGVMGRGLVLCVQADGASAFEQVSDDGRCFDSEVAYSAAANGLAGDLVYREGTGCHDFTIADSLSRLASATPEPSLAPPPLEFVTLLVLPAASSERAPRNSRHQPPTFVATDVAAVRRTVSLLV